MRIFLDENLSEYVADALNLLDKGYFPNVDVVSTKREIGIGKADEEIIPPIGQEGGILITQDNDFKKLQTCVMLCKQYSLGVIFLAPPKHCCHWGKVQLLIKHWEEIINICKSKNPPFAYRVTPRGCIKELY